MKICQVRLRSAFGIEYRLGILLDDTTVLDVNNVWNLKFEKDGRYNASDRANYYSPNSLHKILNLKDNPISFFQESLELFKSFNSKGDLKLKGGQHLTYKLDGNEISLAKPIDKISTYRDFYAHEKHVAKGFEKRKEPIPEAWYEIPAYYKGPSLGFIGPEEEILWPSYTNILDYELELGMIIAKEGKNLKAEMAVDHIFGFTILNDISARDIQKKEMAIRLGPAKGKDFCSVIGPVITTIDEFNGKEPNLLMTATINGEEWSRGHSGDSHFSFAEMIAHVSMDEWVIPGDFFGSGTVGTGCGLEIDKWIQEGDEIELNIEHIGSLKNKIGKKRKS